ncbi:MAG: hypothetical protein ACFB00_01965 [Parvularculaceae bacterium]
MSTGEMGTVEARSTAGSGAAGSGVEGSGEAGPAAVDAARAAAPANPRPLFLQRRFLPLWTALSFGTFADNVLRQALLIGVPYGAIALPGVANPDDAMPVIGALLPAAILIFSTVSGQLADKYETSLMFRRTKVVELALMAVAGASYALGLGWLCVASLFAMGAQSAFFSPVRIGAMPKYLATDELVRGNGICNAGLFTFILLGYAVGGYLIVLEGGGGYVALALVAAAAIGYAAARLTPFAAANEPGLRLDWNAPRQIGKAFGYVTRARGVLPPLLGVAAFYFLTTPVTVVTPLFARETLNAEPIVAVALNGLFAIGACVGALTAAGIAKGRSGLGHSVAAVMAAGVVTMLAPLVAPLVADGGIADGVGDLAPGFDEAANPVFTLGMLFGTGGGLAIVLIFVAASALMGVYVAPLQAAIQRRAPGPVRARIMAASAFANAAFALPGSLSILFVTRTGVDPSLAFAGVGFGMLAVGGVMLRRHGSLPERLYDEALTGGNAGPGRAID